MSQGIDVKGFSVGKALLYLCLVIWLVFSIFPFYWLVVMSTRDTTSIFSYPPKVTFGNQFLVNTRHLLAAIPFFHSMWNSLYVSVISTAAVLFFCSLAGFAFAKFEFPGKKPLFLIMLATMMVPGQLGMVPSFVIMKTLHWVNTFWALIVPGAANAFGIFWIRQYAETAIPDDLLHAGRIDGCGNFRLYAHVALPILRPTLAALGIFTFMGSWNDFMWPLVILNDPKKYTLQVMLNSLNGIYFKDYGMVMAGTLFATIPLLILFFIFSRKLMGAVTVGAIKS
ncbi:sugar ABC transporter permease [Alicyclobacillus cellulosilyticus]|uniref:Sugar ABC transporter permease n=1 Tax=Alicyclobacillus cellulosilyticus TaxID=1003997 RepID=A0A917KEZ2_9BACL|nr:carbohydrate ABC transporter permease [Alicyclobacillus cellulosilyticus]GGJ11702.1 sugar ABC transporter permease [Alicyclobacillus cellulosilyticus]